VVREISCPDCKDSVKVLIVVDQTQRDICCTDYVGTDVAAGKAPGTFAQAYAVRRRRRVTSEDGVEVLVAIDEPERHPGCAVFDGIGITAGRESTQAVAEADSVALLPAIAEYSIRVLIAIHKADCDVCGRVRIRADIAAGEASSAIA